ncbi:hypothetical protein [Agrococcus sp. ProA11]|uniref:hypothetical protein n=1 Tax=Agrococcus chionoecetis TaxID=3153752 RepID=UPI003261B5FC
MDLLSTVRSQATSAQRGSDGLTSGERKRLANLHESREARPHAGASVMQKLAARRAARRAHA